MEITNLAEESPEYHKARAELLAAELALMEQRERVAVLRRQLPAGPLVEDYAFVEGPRDLAAGDEPATTVRLSELFGARDRPLVVYHFMYGKAQETPCPMCTCWIDGFNGVARHLAQNLDFVVVAAAELPALRAFARERGWTGLRLLSCGDSTFKRDLGSEDAEGRQDSEVSVFSSDPAGGVRHRYSAHPWFDAERNQRGIDLLNPVWHVLDLTPFGRKEWFAGLDY